ncbi:hypothetical protein C8R44DRAFT_155934 [Mycena epipterygia]|nr:hypothetical protein C8R44DRAFT_155934 [Mycena epipterygia]
MYAENSAPAVDPYSDEYNTAPPPLPADGVAPRGRTRSRSPAARSAAGRDGGYRSPYRRRSPPAPRRPTHAPIVR